MGIAVAGATYSVNIELNHQSLNKQLGELDTKVKSIGKSAANKAASSKEEEKTQTSINNLLNRNAVQYGRGLRLNKKGVDLKLQEANYWQVKSDVDAGEIKSAKELISLSKLKNTEAANELLISQKTLKAETESAKKDKIRVKGVHDLNKARHTNFNLRSRLDDLDTQGIKVDKLRLKYGNLNTAQGKRDFNLFKDIGSQLNLSLKKEERKLRILRKQTRERNKQLRILSRRSNNMASPIRGDAVRDVGSPAWVDRSARMGGPSSKLNYQRGKLLPGPVGTGAGRPTGVWQSAAISGAFPLLFGQGPVTAAAGALGGGLGAKYGGQMGGFAGGLVATSVASTVTEFVGSVQNLGKALNENTKDVQALSAALGITGTEFEKNLKTLEKLGGEEAAFEAARNKMINLVGQKGVDALTRFGKGTTELANQFTIAMTQMRASFASAFGNTGIGRAVTGQLTKANLLRQSQVSKDPEVIKARKLADAWKKAPIWRTKEDKELMKANPNVGSWNEALGEVQTAQKESNARKDKAAGDKVLADIQAQRVENIDKEIALLEKGIGMSSMEFEIETQIMEIKKDGEIQDESAIRSKLEKLYVLKEEEKATQRLNDLYKNIGSTIKDGLVQGIQAAIDGTKSLGEIAGSVFRKISDALLDFGVSMALSNLPIPGAKKFFGFANGGRPPKGRPSIVGERGPELFVPDSAGTIIPNHEMGGANVVVNVDASGSSVEGDAGAAQELGSMLAAAIQAELVKEKRPGGLLA